jgi:hypothetical protein
MGAHVKLRLMELHFPEEHHMQNKQDRLPDSHLYIGHSSRIQIVDA